jgi:hypothetical protein
MANDGMERDADPPAEEELMAERERGTDREGDDG